MGSRGKPQITVEMKGPSGNIFAAMANAIKALEESGQAGKSVLLQSKIKQAMHDQRMTYQKMLNIIDQYVEVIIE